MNYCSQCGQDQLGWIIPDGDNRPRYVCGHCETIHYQNPKMVVGCLAFYGERILLCRRAIQPRYGYWNLPAGYLENGETAEAGALREVREEADIDVDLIGMHALYSIPRINQIYLFFLARLRDAQVGIGPESLESRLFLPTEIPYPEMAFPSSTYAIRRYLEDSPKVSRRVHIGGWKES